MDLMVTSSVEGNAAHITVAWELNSANADVIRQAVENVIAAYAANLFLYCEESHLHVLGGPEHSEFVQDAPQGDDITALVIRYLQPE